MKRLAAALTAPLLLAPALTGCSGGDGGALTVVTSFYPLEYVAQRIAGNRADVLNLTQPGREPHDLELTVRQTVDLADADLVLYESGLQPAVDDAVDTTSPEHVVDARDVGHVRDDDPHFWLDPERLSAVAAATAAELSKADPAHKREYDANLADLQKDLDRLDHDFRTGLAHCRVTTVVVSHDAFGYLSKYGLSFAPITGLSPESEPSPAHLAELQRLAEDKGVTTVFHETLTSPAAADTLAQDLGLTTGVLDPIEGLSDETSGDDYLSLMRADLAALRKAGDCT